jgi:hypothetical protein
MLLFKILKQLLIVKKGCSSRDMYFLREIMRTLLSKQNILNKQDLFFVDRVFSNLRFFPDNTMLKTHFIDAFSSEVNSAFKRYAGKLVDPKSRNLLTEQTHNGILDGQFSEICQLTRCILNNNPTPFGEEPHWANDLQLESGSIDNKNSRSIFAHDELRAFSIMTYQMPWALDIDEEEKKYLCLLLSRLHLINSPKALREEIVKLVDFDFLVDKYTTQDPELFYYPKILGKMGNSEALLRLGWAISIKSQ